MIAVSLLTDGSGGEAGNSAEIDIELGKRGGAAPTEYEYTQGRTKRGIKPPLIFKGGGEFVGHPTIQSWKCGN